MARFLAADDVLPAFVIAEEAGVLGAFDHHVDPLHRGRWGRQRRICPEVGRRSALFVIDGVSTFVPP
jgi:hypothetical protein